MPNTNASINEGQVDDENTQENDGDNKQVAQEKQSVNKPSPLKKNLNAPALVPVMARIELL